jgi:neurotransmitter:Na+ symporter, NSS family
LLETIAFAWVFGMEKGWEEITRGADIKVPYFFKYIIKYVTPLFLIAVFFGSAFKPMDGSWIAAFSSLIHGHGWPLAADSVIGTILNKGIADKRWLIDGLPTQIFVLNMTRLLLLATFIGIGVAIFIAWRRKEVKQ